MVDYSKWDKLELSDDSDIEVHPNVDKKSFIRWKQRDIHEKRAQRKEDIQNLKLSNQVNTTLLSLVEQITQKLETGPDVIDESNIAAAFRIDEAKVGEAPTGQSGASYQQMLMSLFEEIRKSIKSADGDGKEAYLRELRNHKKKIGEEIVKNEKELAKLEKEEKSKITSEGLHEGFSTSYVAKPKTSTSHKPASSSTKKPESKPQLQTIEVLNPLKEAPPAASSGADADSENSEEEDQGNDEDITPTDLGKKFGEIKLTELKKSMLFIEDNPPLVSERNQDGLLLLAFNAAMEGKESLAKQYVHQALLLQYVKQVGRGGVKTFFAGISDRNHKAHAVFYDDVNNTFTRIRTRAKEIIEERGDTTGGVEQIQLQAVDPDTAIHINVPPPHSDDPEVQEARKIFESFPPGLQRALERGALEDINVVLGKMAVDEAEEVVDKLGQGGMLSIEPKIIDTTKGETIPERPQVHVSEPILEEVREEELD